jgi:hypothetical protein
MYDRVDAILGVFIPDWRDPEDGVSACGGAHFGVTDSDSSGGDRNSMLPLNATSSGGSGG